MIIISRFAGPTIKGFLYQFNLTLETTMKSLQDSYIQVEGIIEDIDVYNEGYTKAIQCKYHESQETFNLSTIYKPILQMLKNYCQYPDANIEYILYAYFPSLPIGIKVLTVEEIINILNTDNVNYICNYITYINPPKEPEIMEIAKKVKKTSEDKDKIKGYYDKNRPISLIDSNVFFEEKFKLEIGKSYEDLETYIKKLLIDEDLFEDDVNEIFYPNAIHKIAEISIISNESERYINKSSLLESLKETKKTAISRWTKELTDYNKHLKTRRKQLATNLNLNMRNRCFIFESDNIYNFYDDLVIFIKDFVDVYCHKPKLHQPAIFCIKNSEEIDIQDLESRLYSKGITVETGYRGSTFFTDAFIRYPEKKIKENWIQFKLRIIQESDEFYKIINNNKPDDIFVIGNKEVKILDIRDINIEVLDVFCFDELKYLLQLTEEVR